MTMADEEAKGRTVQEEELPMRQEEKTEQDEDAVAPEQAQDEEEQPEENTALQDQQEDAEPGQDSGQHEADSNEGYGISYVKEEKSVAVDEHALEIKDLPDSKRIIGTERVFKLLRDRSLAKVFMTSNTPEEIRLEIKHLAALSDTPIVSLGSTNAELGLICRKPFPISVLGARR